MREESSGATRNSLHHPKLPEIDAMMLEPSRGALALDPVLEPALKGTTLLSPAAIQLDRKHRPNGGGLARAPAC